MWRERRRPTFLLKMNGFLLWLINIFIMVMRCTTEVNFYTFDNFPKDKTALHMPCSESNMFATKCMCHLKCTDSNCNNARRLCEKYETSKGCKYVFIRGYANKVATLKRVPLQEELLKFDISMFPNTSLGLTRKGSKWQTLIAQQTSLRSSSGPLIRDMVNGMGERGRTLIDKIFTQPVANRHCGTRYLTSNITAASKQHHMSEFLSRGFAMVALSYHSPKTLVNSLRTWNSSGFLDMMREKHIILNDPMPAETAMALDFGLQILEPRNIPDVKLAKPNVVTIGAAFYYALHNSNSEYVIFLENDFKMDTALSAHEIQAQLVMAAGMLDSGIEVVRLNSRKYQGCGTFKDCNHHGINLLSSSPSERKRNWFAFYCRDQKNTADSVSDCSYDPDFRCFTSWDTNWTLNAVMVKKSTMLQKQYPVKGGKMKTLAEIGLEQYKKQDGFESVMGFDLPWPHWRVPICIAYDGLFIHEEIETGA